MNEFEEFLNYNFDEILLRKGNLKINMPIFTKFKNVYFEKTTDNYKKYQELYDLLQQCEPKQKMKRGTNTIIYNIQMTSPTENIRNLMQQKNKEKNQMMYLSRFNWGTNQNKVDFQIEKQNSDCVRYYSDFVVQVKSDELQQYFQKHEIEKWKGIIDILSESVQKVMTTYNFQKAIIFDNEIDFIFEFPENREYDLPFNGNRTDIISAVVSDLTLDFYKKSLFNFTLNLKKATFKYARVIELNDNVNVEQYIDRIEDICYNRTITNLYRKMISEKTDGVSVEQMINQLEDYNILKCIMESTPEILCGTLIEQVETK